MLLKLKFLLGCLMISLSVFSQKKWQQQVDHTMQVRFDPAARTLDAEQLITYHNNSRDTLHYIYLHIWPNAYKNDHTAFSEQLLINNRLDFYFSKEEDRGYINRLVFSSNNETLEWIEDSLHQDFGKLMLASPLPPGESVSIINSFHVQLPRLFSRSGYKNDFFAITQWYPKPAVYDEAGWHPMPYLDQGEFFNEFGNYDVQITLPSRYKLVATGKRVAEEISGGSYTVRYQQDNCTDFAWFSSPDFVLQTDTLVLPSGKQIDLTAAVLKKNQHTWANSLNWLREALLTRSSWLGDYPWSVMTIVDGYQGPGGGGMEYPTITVLNEIKDPRELDITIAHEVGHNWFALALANNEREAPWLDEGINSYYDKRYEALRYGDKEKALKFPANRLPDNQSLAAIRGLESIGAARSPLETAEALRPLTYGLMVYEKAALQLKALEEKIGRDSFDNRMRAYVSEHLFSHPGINDWQKFFPMEDAVPGDRPLEQFGKRRARASFLFNSREPEKYHYIGIGPAIGINKYDGLQLGLFFHNYQLPLPRFRFFLAPTYGTSSGNFGGLGRLSYHWYPENKSKLTKNWSVGADFLRAKVDQFNVEPTHLRFTATKLAPFIKWQFAQRSPLSAKESFVQFKSFLIWEDALQSQRVIDGNDTSYIDRSVNHQRGLQQLRLYHADHRVLYPYEIDGKIESNSNFTRLGLTASWYLNYPNQEGGLQARFFGGKFITHGHNSIAKQITNNRYYLNMTGANGYEDYTYSNYFPGRNEFSGWMSQQIMIKDGGFKVRTDLLGNKIGRSADWLTALNLTADVPSSINPLSKLPVKIPLKVFLDLGTYAEAWDTDEEDDRAKFLMDAGLQISLLQNLVNIYIPVINSKPFRDYHQSTLGEKRFFKTISFSIDIQRLSVNRWLSHFGL